jgi:hypothetical protein
MSIVMSRMSISNRAMGVMARRAGRNMRSGVAATGKIIWKVMAGVQREEHAAMRIVETVVAEGDGRRAGAMTSSMRSTGSSRLEARGRGEGRGPCPTADECKKAGEGQKAGEAYVGWLVALASRIE